MTTTGNIIYPLFKVLGAFIMLLYKLCNSYVLAIVLFTIAIKLVLYPTSLMSKKSMMKTQALQGRMQQLQKQYGKDQTRYNQEVQKLYAEEGVNPTSGCLWSLLPLPILMGVYAIIRRPLFYIYCLTTEQMEAINGVIEKFDGWNSNASYLEIEVANRLTTDQSFLEACKTALGDGASKLDTLINFNFLGINLAETPKLKFWEGGITWNSVGLFLIPILVAVISGLTSWVSQKTNAINQEKKDKDNPADKTTKQMLIMMPLMYLWFGFIMPAGMCVYMMVTCIVQALQEVLSARLLRSKFMQQQTAREEAERQKKLEEKRARIEKIEARQKEEEENRKKKRKAANAEGSKKLKGETTDKGAVGIRRYAKGRNYEPDRFGGVTPYRDPQEIIDEAAVEAALAENKKKKKKNSDEELPEETPAVTGAEEADAPAAETPVEETPAEEASAEEAPAAEEEN